MGEVVPIVEFPVEEFPVEKFPAVGNEQKGMCDVSMSD